MAGNKVSNRKILTQGDNIYARKKGERFGVDEVTFDKGARSYVYFLQITMDYLFI